MKKVKIGWLEYTIKEVSSQNINFGDGEFRGKIHYGPQEILINKDYPRDNKKATMVHEILHAINEFAGLDLSEEQIEGLANMIVLVLKDNRLWK